MAREYWHCKQCGAEQPVGKGTRCERCGTDLLLYGDVIYKNNGEPEPEPAPEPEAKPVQEPETKPEPEPETETKPEPETMIAKKRSGNKYRVFDHVGFAVCFAALLSCSVWMLWYYFPYWLSTHLVENIAILCSVAVIPLFHFLYLPDPLREPGNVRAAFGENAWVIVYGALLMNAFSNKKADWLDRDEFTLYALFYIGIPVLTAVISVKLKNRRIISRVSFAVISAGALWELCTLTHYLAYEYAKSAEDIYVWMFLIPDWFIIFYPLSYVFIPAEVLLLFAAALLYRRRRPAAYLLIALEQIFWMIFILLPRIIIPPPH